MSTETRPLVTENVGLLAGYGILLGVGTLLVVYGIRDLLLFLEGYTFGTSGYGVDAVRILAATSAGWFLLLSGLMKWVHLAITEPPDDVS